jgi:bifunctional non-homologous end joining protein LigD
MSPARKKSVARKRAVTGVKRAAKKSTAKKSTAKKSAASKSTTRKSAAKKSASPTPLAEYNRKRDFSRTKEPEGRVPKQKGKALQFVIQKHAASHLHYDFRLELDGVMKSWAVPKGPSLDPSVRRLAMEVEDHPISYNTFEGTIPAGEYGGGTVMLWDRGTYDAEDGGGAESLRRGYAKGDLKITMKGKRLRGSWVLVRMNRPGRPQWLLIKHRDETADPDRDITAEYTTSVVSRRTMESIATGKGGGNVWHSNR